MYLTNFMYNHFMFRTDSAISIILSSLNFLSVLLPPEDDLWTAKTCSRLPYIQTILLMCILLVLLRCYEYFIGRSQWQRDLRRRSAAALRLRSWVRIPPEARKFVCCECCLLSVRGLCDELITRPEDTYQLWCVVVCDLENSWMRRSCPTGGCCAKNKQQTYIRIFN
jgi:hypothetical protein